MIYLYYFLAVLGITVLLTFIFWMACVILDNHRYKRAIDRRVKELDLEMKRRGGGMV